MPEKLMYKGLPLVRAKNELYYGSPNDTHVVFIQILDTVEQGGAQVATKTHVQLVSNDPNLGPKARIEKESDKQGLFNALEIGEIWLRRALSGR